MRPTVRACTRDLVEAVFQRLDYEALGPIYCHEGGDEFWRAKRVPAQRLGLALAGALLRRLKRGGRSLYVGAGVAELPMLLAETLDLNRRVEAYTLRRREVRILNRACRPTPVRFTAADALAAHGLFDHLWIVSVLNDPETYPNLSPLSYGRADPLRFDPDGFAAERRAVRRLVDRSLRKLSRPGLVTTSTEEVQWIAEWCHHRRVPYRVERRSYPTALVGDPVCFVRIEAGARPAGGGTGRRPYT